MPKKIIEREIIDEDTDLSGSEHSILNTEPTPPPTNKKGLKNKEENINKTEMNKKLRTINATKARVENKREKEKNTLRVSSRGTGVLNTLRTHFKQNRSKISSRSTTEKFTPLVFSNKHGLFSGDLFLNALLNVLIRFPMSLRSLYRLL